MTGLPRRPRGLWGRVAGRRAVAGGDPGLVVLYSLSIERIHAWSALIIGALILIAAAPQVPFEPSLAIRHLPNWLQFGIGLPIASGGALLLCGLRRRSALSTRGVGLIRAGSTLVASGFAADAVAILSLAPEGTVQMTFAATGALIGWQRQRLVAREMRQLRHLQGDE